MTLDKVGALTVFVDDLARTEAFYDSLLGRPPAMADETSRLYQLDGLFLNLVLRSCADELIEPAVVATSGSRFMLTIFVDDLAAELARLDVPLLNGPQDRPWGVRTAAFADPDGHVWELAQDLPHPD